MNLLRRSLLALPLLCVALSVHAANTSIIRIDLGGPPTAVVNESERSVSLVVTLSVGSGNVSNPPVPFSVDLNYVTQGGTATEGLDFDAVAGTLTFSETQLTQSIVVPITDDDIVERDEKFTVVLSDPTRRSGNVSFTPRTLGASTKVTIVDNDVASSGIEFVSSSLRVVENIGNAVVTVRRVSGFGGDVEVNYATTDGSANAPEDYVATSGSLTWAAGDQGDRTFSIPILDDGIVELDESLTIFLTDPNNANASPETATLTIDDDDENAVIELVSANVIAVENGGEVQVIARRSGNDTSQVSVDFVTSDGSANASQDYAATSGTLVWADGELGDKVIYIPVLDDMIEEPSENFDLSLSNVIGQAEFGLVTSTAITIQDDDERGSAVFVNTPLTVDESVGTATIRVERQQGVDGDLVVDYTTVAATAVEGLDFVASTGTLAWTDGDASIRTVSVTILDDGMVEPDEQLSLSLTDQSDPQAPPALGLLTINDDDEPAVLDFIDLSVTTNEAGDIVTLAVSRTGNETGAVTVDFVTNDGSAMAGEDYASVSGTFSWQDGETGEKSVDISIVDDTDIEGDEDFTITLFNVTGPAELNSNPTVTVVITDNDVVLGNIVFNNTPLTVSEDAGTATITLSRVNGSVGDIEIEYVTSDDSAVAGEDYTAVSGNLVWANGDVADKTISIPITDDAAVEDAESLNITLTNVNDLNAGPITEDLTILDNDEPSVLDFVDLSVTTNEAGDLVTLVVSRTGNDSGQVSVDFATADGSAVAGEDYTSASGVLSWQDGETGEKSVDISIVDDTDIEGDEDFTITLSNVDGSASLTTQPTVTVVITDDDEPSVLDFVDLSVTTNEAGDVVTLVVARTGTSAGEVTVDFATADGSAVAVDDYGARSGTFTWADGESGNRTLDVPIVDDIEEEGDEDFTITLSNVTGPAELGSDAVVTVIIADNDVPTGTVNFVDLDISVDEDAGTTLITLRRENGSAGELSVSYLTDDVTANAGTDYQSSTGTVVWSDGDALDKSISVAILDDAQVEDDETFTITLTDPDDPAGQPVIAEVTIVDNDASANLEFLISSVTAGEEAGTVSVTVARTGSPPGDLVVDFTTVDGSAFAPADYQAVSGTLTWADGETTTRTIEIPIIDDGFVEGDEVFTVRLVDRNDPTAPPILAVVRIQDNDVNAGLGFTDLNVTTNERGDAVSLTVTRTGNSTGAVTVDFATEDGSATAGEDYAAVSGTLSWSDGELGNKNVDIAILDDNVFEDDEDFTVILSNITGQAMLGANNTITIVIGASDGQRNISLPKLTPNQLRLANWFDSTCPRLAAASDLSEAQQDLNAVCQTIRSTDTTDDEVCDTLEAIMPDELSVASFNALRLTAIQHGNLSQRINALRNGATGIDLAGLDIEINGEVIAGTQLQEFLSNLVGGSAGDGGTTWERWGIFLDGRIATGEKDKSDYEAGFDFDIYGFTAGIDYRVKQNFIVGVALGYGHVDSDFQRGGGGMDIDSVSGAAFLTYFSDSTYYFDALATWGRNEYESTRNIAFDTGDMSVRRQARGETDGDQYSFGIGSGFDFSKDALTYGPHFGGYYFNVVADEFTETGASGLELRVGEQHSESLTVNLGGHFSYAVTTDWGVLVPNARFDWVREFKDNRETLSFSFRHDPFANDPLSPSSQIKIETDRPDSSYFIWSVGVHTQLIHGISGFVDFKSYTGYDNVTLNEATWGVRWEKAW